MKTKHLFSLVAAVALVGMASSAQAGVSLSFSFGLPLPPLPPLPGARAVVIAAPCPPPVVYHPPVVVYQSAPCRPVVYVAPRYERHDDHCKPWGSDHGRSQRGWERNDRGGRR